ncbi:unnamed protein product [Coregonus sp. 'balchen']|nr:unnamed protein product [Coregonus sp. 'balchen']
MKLTRALSDLVKYTKSVGVSDIEKQAASSSWLVSSLSETKAHQIMQQKAATFIHFNQRQLSRIYPSSYRVDSSNFNPQPFWNAGCHLVALNYQSEGRVLQLNRAKFSSNGNCGYILKPASMCEVPHVGAFNPMIEDPFPGQMKKQLVLKIISGQQLPKPKDSMLGDRGEIIDPFVEVEIIGIPVDCCKEQTRVVDDNGFNPMWEETLVFMLHMPQLALVRFLVWDHDPIGQDFIGQRTIAFNSMIPGYRHVYLEGMEAASIFVHVSVHDVTGKRQKIVRSPEGATQNPGVVKSNQHPACATCPFPATPVISPTCPHKPGKVASGIKGLFHRNPKQASLDSHAAAQLSHKQPFGAHLLRRTASAPTKVQPKVKKGFPEIAIDTKDYRSEGTSEDRESEDRDLNASSQPPLLHQHNWDTTAGAAPTASRQGTNKHHGTNKAFHPNEGKGKGSPRFLRYSMSEPLKQVNWLRCHDSLNEKPGVFARVALNSSGRMGVQVQPEPMPMPKPQALAAAQPDESLPLLQPQAFFQPIPFPKSRAKARQTLDTWHTERNACSCIMPRRRFPSPPTTPHATLTPDCWSSLHWQCAPLPNYGRACGPVKAPHTTIISSDCDSLSVSDSCSSCDSLGSLELAPMLPPQGVLDSGRHAVGTLQREMNLLFAQMMDELHSKSPMFFADHSTAQRPAPPIRLLAPIADELGDRHLTHSSSTPVDHSSIRHSPPPPLPTSTAITIFTLSPASKSEADSSVNGRGEEGPVNGRGEEGPVNGRGEEGPVNGRGEEGPVNGRGEEGPVKCGGDNKRPPALHRTTSAPVVPTPGVGPDPKDLNPSQYSRDPRVDDGTSSPMERAPSRAEAPYTHSEYTKDDAELKTEPSAESPVPLADPSVDSSPLEVQALRALFGGSPKNTPVRRTKSEGHVRAVAVGQQQSSAMPEVCTDATLNDRLWSKLEPKPGGHRDSVSSSSSISSNDTVIDLSLPNLARKTLTCLSSGPSLGDDIFPDPPSWVNRPRSAIASFDTPRVSKSKSNPNLLQGHLGEPEDELQPRPLGAPREPPVDSPSRITQRRHTWSRLYMEGLKQSSPPAKKPSAVAALAASATSPLDTGASMSKSLGDLTSDDIACNFDSKYRSISRSFSIRPSRNDPRRGYPNPQRPRLPSDLTEQLRRLTDVEPLTARDFAPQVQQGPLAEAQEEPPLRRTSSRSQSRVRYIAKRAKQAQERQRLQGLNQPHPATGAANTSISGGGSPMEERGNPEGACCVARSPCASLDLLSQLSPPGPPNRQSQTSLNSDNDEVFFMLQL